ncbi:hypothetical protein CcI6DRAFT_03681, partial [Frankia sp. CcI6]
MCWRPPASWGRLATDAAVSSSVNSSGADSVVFIWIFWPFIRASWNFCVADRWYPSSKTCSDCGWRNPGLTLSDRIFACQSCGLVGDRDLNAAVNLSNLVAAS